MLCAGLSVYRWFGNILYPNVSLPPHTPRTLIPVLHQKAKRGTPHQAKQAVHCIHAIFNNKEVQLAQIFEVGRRRRDPMIHHGLVLVKYGQDPIGGPIQLKNTLCQPFLSKSQFTVDGLWSFVVIK